MHLINKDETEFTGQETFVWKLYQERCWDFFPVGDCFRKQECDHYPNQTRSQYLSLIAGMISLIFSADGEFRARRWSVSQ